MREKCERCEAVLRNDSDIAFICSFECTFCSSCTSELENRCPNCGGNLVQRPVRKLGV